MDEGIISSRYAKALLKLAAERKDTQEVYQGMMSLCDSFFRVPNLRSALENPVVESDRKLRLLTVAAGETPSTSLKDFFALVIKNHRISIVQLIAYSFVDTYRKSNNLIHSHLIIPTQVDDAIIDRLKNLVRQKTQNEVEFDVEVDPSLIGGFVMEYDNYSLDASIQGRLNSIRKKLLADDKFQLSN